MIEKKTCTQCQKSKEIPLDFYMIKGKYKSECKACVLLRAKEYRGKLAKGEKKIKNKDKINAYMKEYRRKNPEKFKKYKNDFLDKHPGYFEAYYVKNRKPK